MRPVLPRRFALSFNQTNMDLIASRTADNTLWRAHESDLHSTPRAVPYAPTTAIERFLLTATLAVLPVEDHIPTVGGFSLLFIMFGVMAGYVFLWRARVLNRTWLHPTFLAGYILLFVCLLIESGHPHSSYGVLIRFGQMLVGGVAFASLCRDKAALRAAAHGYLIGGIWLSGYLFFATYGVLTGVAATNFNEASMARAAATDDLGLEGDLNNMAFLAAQGGVVALALTLSARSALRRALWLGVTAFCLLGASLPMSRGGIINAVVSCVVVLFTIHRHRFRTMAMAIVLGALMWTVIPGVVFQRMSVTEHGGRSKVYTGLKEHMSEYLVIGVGNGNYWSSWAAKNGIVSDSGNRLGAHNTFLQMTVNWGLPALIALLALIWQAYRCLPKGCAKDADALWIPAIATSILLMTFFTHTFYDKWISLGLGLLVGVSRWVWPSGKVE